MSGRAILFVAYALRGHAEPMLAVARELARRGRRAVVAIPEEGRAWIGDAGVECVAWDFRLPGGRRLTELQQRAREAASQCRCQPRGQWHVISSMAATHIPIHRALQPVVESVRPAVIVTSQISVPAMDLAVSAGIPLVIQCFFLPAGIRGASPLRPQPWRSSMAWRRRVEARYWSGRLGRALRRHERSRRACSECIPIRDIYRSSAIISILPECVEEQVPSLPGLHHVGPLTAESRPLDGRLQRWLDDHRPQGVVLVAFGRFVRLDRRQVEVLAEGLHGHGKRVLWVLPAHSHGLLPAGLASIRIESHLDQSSVLAHPAVEAFVSHGGSNSFAESLHWGKPLLIMPFMLDQPYIAAKALELGVGLAVDPFTMTAAAVREGLSELLGNPVYGERARWLGERVRSTPGLARAADIVEAACR